MVDSMVQRVFAVEELRKPALGVGKHISGTEWIGGVSETSENSNVCGLHVSLKKEGKYRIIELVDFERSCTRGRD